MLTQFLAGMATAGKKKAILSKENLQIIVSKEKRGKQTDLEAFAPCKDNSKQCNISESETLNRKFKSSDICSDCKRFGSANHKDMDAALLVWLKQERQKCLSE